MHPVFGWFDRAYVINLPSRADRRRSIDAQLSRVGLRFDGARVVLFPGIVPEQALGFPSVGARGCFLSHLAVLEAAEVDNLESVVIMEDDLGFVPNLDERMKLIIPELKRVSWDMLYFGHSAGHATTELLSVQDVAVGLPCLHFYAVSRAFRRELIPFLHDLASREPGSPNGGPMHVDGAISLFRARHPEFTTRLVNPPLGHQLSSRSNITPRWFDKLSLLRRPVAVARGLRSSAGHRLVHRH